MACSWEYNGIYSQHNNYITNGNLGTLVFCETKLSRKWGFNQQQEGILGV